MALWLRAFKGLNVGPEEVKLVLLSYSESHEISKFDWSKEFKIFSPLSSLIIFLPSVSLSLISPIPLSLFLTNFPLSQTNSITLSLLEVCSLFQCKQKDQIYANKQSRKDTDLKKNVVK